MENATATFSLWLMGGVDGYRGCGTHEHVYIIGCFATLGRNHMAAPFTEAYVHTICITKSSMLLTLCIC